MQEREQRAEPSGSEDLGSRERVSPFKRYAWTLISAVVRPRNLRKENYDAARVFGPVVFTLISTSRRFSYPTGLLAAGPSLLRHSNFPKASFGLAKRSPT